ncbi:MAG: 6-phosphofructokinase [Candidatus Promineifilaceae bacterium]
MNKRVAVLTGGGDVPGLNACLKQLTYRAVDAGYDVLGVRKGWEGFLNYEPNDPSMFSNHFIELTKSRVRAIDQSSGSFLHSSRLDPRHTPASFFSPAGGVNVQDAQSRDMTEKIISAIDHLGLSGLVVLGDDDMLHFAAQLSSTGMPLIAIPKTIHNNICGTDYTLGFSTGLARGVDFIQQLRALAGSREQIVVVETFGENSGYSTLLTAFLAGVDRVIIPEVPYDPVRLAHLAMLDKQLNPNNYAMVTITNGSRIAAQHLEAARGYLSSHNYAEVLFEAETRTSSSSVFHSGGLIAAEMLQNITGEEVFCQQLTYLMRTGAPDGQDLLGASNFALMAIYLLRHEMFGRMTAFRRGETWTHVDLSEALRQEKMVDTENWYDSENYRPTDHLIWSAQD